MENEIGRETICNIYTKRKDYYDFCRNMSELPGCPRGSVYNYVFDIGLREVCKQNGWEYPKAK